MSMEFRRDYWDDNRLKGAFIKFLVDIHGLDLTKWGRLGYWDDANFRPYSFFKNGAVVSSLCLYSMDMTIRGKRCRVGQFSGVGTLAEFRRQGLNLELTRRALEWAKPRHDFFFLFADDEAFPFYGACGFRTVKEHQTSYAVSGAEMKGVIERLDMENDEHRSLVYGLACDRESVSSILGVHNEKLLMYWCLYGLADCIYRVRELNTVVLMKRGEKRLDIYDIVSRSVPSFDELYRYIGEPSDREVVFHFMPDRMRLDAEKVQMIEIETGAHLMGDFPFEGEHFLIPCTAHA